MLPSILFLALLIFGTVRSESESQEHNPGSSVDKDSSPFLSKTNICGNKLNVKFKHEDIDNGNIIAEFPLLPPNYDLYKVELMIYEDIRSEEECVSNGKKSRSVVKVHSKREHQPNLNTSFGIFKSNKYEKLNFTKVFSGCYELQIIPHNGSNSDCRVYSNAVYIKTGYSKTEIERPSILFSKYLNKTGTYEIKFNVNLTFDGMEIIFFDGLKKHAVNECQANGNERSRCYLLKKGNGDPDLNITCKAGSSCSVNSDVECTFYNATPGNYCVKFEVQDIRCIHGTVWNPGNNCKSLYIYDTRNDQPDNPLVIMNTSSVFILSLVFIILIIVMGFSGGLVFLFKKKSLFIPMSEENLEEAIIPMVSDKKVLLLYPRDCEQFMGVMKSFAKLLEKSDSIKVFDSFDDDEAMDGPLAWLQRVMNDPRLSTIIVTSHVACLHEELIKSGLTGTRYSLYRDPTYLDKLFVYGLKSIMENISSDVYERIYIIGFDGFSDDNSMLSLPTSFRRYTIPNHLSKLLSDMNVSSYSRSQLENTLEYVTLKSCIQELAKYKSKNPFYIEDLLNTSQMDRKRNLLF